MRAVDYCHVLRAFAPHYSFPASYYPLASMVHGWKGVRDGSEDGIVIDPVIRLLAHCAPQTYLLLPGCCRRCPSHFDSVDFTL